MSFYMTLISSAFLWSMCPVYDGCQLIKWAYPSLTSINSYKTLEIGKWFIAHTHNNVVLNVCNKYR